MLCLIQKYGVSVTNQTTVTIAGTAHGLGTADIGFVVYALNGSTLTWQEVGDFVVNTGTFDVTIDFRQAFTGRVVLFG
jgi:hypothetical protein